MSVLYKADLVRGAEWRRFAERAPDVPFRLWGEKSSAPERRAPHAFTCTKSRSSG
jgi:hypothetical protein